MSIRVAAVTLLQRYSATSNSASGATIRHCSNSYNSSRDLQSNHCDNGIKISNNTSRNLSSGNGDSPALCVIRRTLAQASMVDDGRQHDDNVHQKQNYHYDVHIVDAIMQDHKEIKSFYQQYTMSSDAHEKAKWSNQWRWAVARHSIGEELVTYTAMEKYINGGDCIADKDRRQHQTVKENLAKLEGVGRPDDPRFESLMQETEQTLEQHMREEEEHYLPMLRNAIPEDEGRRLGSTFQLTKKFVPTHSHPDAPDKPPFETIVGLMAAPIDKLRDMFEEFPTQEEINNIAKSN